MRKSVPLLTCAKVIIVLGSISGGSSRFMEVGEKWKLLSDLYKMELGSVNNSPTRIQSKVVFPVPEDVVTNRSYLPDLGFLADIAFLFLPNFSASGFVRLSRDLFESEQCVQYVSCKITTMAQGYSFLNWIQTFLEDFPFQGDVADRIRIGTRYAITKSKRETPASPKTLIPGLSNANKNDEICDHSCNPMNSLSRGLKILTLLHDLVRTVKL